MIWTLASGTPRVRYYRNRMKELNVVAALAVCAALAACSVTRGASGPQGSRHTYQSSQTPAAAAACFARNAEEHSSALVAEVQSQPDWAQVIVSVRNGAFYASADFRRTGSGARGEIVLNVTTSGRRNDLFSELVQGCR